MATTTLQATLEQARRLLENNDTERAIAVIQHILKHFPKNLEAERMLGEAYFASREYEQAKEAFQRVLAADPENIPAHFGLGLVYEHMGRIDGAVREFEQALEIKPDMPELRSQLLRLYSEAWGQEGAQLRLSRFGLARLYAKGNMLTQAVQEFRGVVTDHPDRLDAQIGLAEALWRDGQEDAAAAESEAILARHPDVLKANLLLGYIRLASGDPAEAARGAANWRTALELDPQQTVAKALFETLPNIAPAENSMPAWDEGLWLTQQATARIEEEQRSYAQVAASNAALPTYTADDESFLADALFQPIAPDVPDIPEEPDEADILARLFAAESKFQDVLLPDESEYSPVTDTELEVTPFSFDDFGTDSSSFSPQGSADDTGLDFAFSLEDHSEDAPPATLELFSFDAPEQAIPQVDAADTDEPDMTPFSFADLGLSPEEIALMQAPVDDDASAAPTLPADADEPDMTPFSFADLGLSPEEIALMQGEIVTPDAPDTTAMDPNFDEPFSGLTEVQPFDWSLDVGDDIPSPTGQSTGADLHMDDPIGTVQPFSWSDMDADAGGDQFSFEQAAPPSKPTPAAAAQPVQPFSLDDLNLDDPLLGGNDDSLPISLQPFSMDDLDIAGLTDDDSDEMGLSAFSMGFPTMSERSSSIPMDSLPTLSDEDAPHDNAAYSWQTPSSRAAPSFASDNDDEHEAPPSSGESIFNKLKQRRQEIVVEEEPLAPVSLDDDDEAAQFFSTDDVSLRLEESGDADEHGMRAGIIGLSGLAAAVGLANTDELTTPEPTASAEPAEPALIPFSLTDLGLSPEEIAMLEAMNTGATGDTFAPEPEPEPITPSTPDEPELTPFSLTDLGLSPEEIAMLEAMNTGATGDTFAPEPEPEPTIPSTPDEPELTPFSLTDLGLSPEEIAMLETTTTGDDPFLTAPEPEPTLEPFQALPVQPFSAADFGLDNLDDESFDSPTNSVPLDSRGTDTLSDLADVGIQPFSLDDIGLDDSFSLSFDDDNDGRLGLTEAELSALDFSGSTASTSHSPEDALQVLMDLGKQQGFVDLTDIINAVENPLVEPERIEEIGRALHQAGIEIRDGDEIIPMDDDEVYEDEEYVVAASELEQELAIAEPEPAMPAVPDVSAATEESFDFDLGAFDLNIPDFSEADLAQEIAAAEPPAQPAAPPPASTSDDEPIIAPLSLADFGLSPEEIAMLGLDASSGLDAIQDVTDTSASEPVAPVAPEPSPPAPEDDFGLSPTQLDKLRSRARNAEAEAGSKRTEPEVKPFSLEDLGLSPAEIEGLGLELAATAPEPEGLDDSFDFGMLDAMGGAPKVERTRPRPVDEPPPPPSAEDLAFTPEPLEGLDDIWDKPPPGVSEVPARVVLPPRPEPRQTRVLTRPLNEDVVPTARARDPRARPLRADRKEAPQRGGRYVSLSELRASGNAPDTFADPTEAPPPPPRQPAAPVRPTPPAAPVAPAPPQATSRPPIGEQLYTGNALIDQYIDQLAGNPDNVLMRLAVARLSAHAGYPDVALQQYKLALRSDTMLTEIGDDLQDLIEELSDPTVLRRLYRLLGDIYTRQGNLHRAMQAYSWTP